MEAFAKQNDATAGEAATGGCEGEDSQEVLADCPAGGCDSIAVTGEEFGLSAQRHRAWGALLRAHAQATARIGGRAEAEGALPLDWYDVLLVLEYAPGGRLRMGELARHVTLSRSGLTRLIDRIEAAGLVQRHLCPQDRRSFETVLTPARRRARKSWPIYARAIAAGFGERYDDEEAATLTELLGRQVGRGGAEGAAG